MTWFEHMSERAAKGEIDFDNDTFKVALSNSAPSAANDDLTDITEISYTNLSSRTLTVSAVTRSGGTTKIFIDDLILTASGVVATYRYIIIYDDTTTPKYLIMYKDHGSAIDLVAADEHDINFDQTNGAIQITES